MPFDDRPALSSWQIAGCAAYAVSGTLISLFFMGMAALADCPTDVDCLSETSRKLMFYGVPLAVLAGGAYLIRHFMRDDK
jgi:hypothetical protein